MLKTGSENTIFAALSQKREGGALSIQDDREHETAKRWKADGDVGELSVTPTVSLSPSNIAVTFQSLPAVLSGTACGSILDGKTEEGDRGSCDNLRICASGKSRTRAHRRIRGNAVEALANQTTRTLSILCLTPAFIILN